ncbi:hypothetical protein M569_02383 [Genlisea aurea]|uniref:Peroxidase n=1 Tax=Genlisea aurea TaxID=192259 RepID=S8E952_9LAMI|nr:hypothetical protein M569_02383 [Genlisea aurea]
MAAIHDLIFALAVFASLLLRHAKGDGFLLLNYYQETCPNLEEIVSDATADILAIDVTLAPSLLRLFFHDCFVRGCEGSVLLNSTASNEAEKDAEPNLTLAGFPEIDLVKARVEEQCPGVVSCADILALVARDSVAQVGGPNYLVPLGRRDGVVSYASEAIANLPSPSFDLTHLVNNFASKGLDLLDLLVLSAAHTIGFAHCASFSNRLYNFSATSYTDPSLDPHYAKILQAKCPPNQDFDGNPMDYITPVVFDHYYFNLVSSNKGLFQSDAALLNDPLLMQYIETHKTNVSDYLSFFEDFGVSMLKMGSIQVLTGNEGEIRKICSLVNT